jgi:hypothetical protein
LVPDRDRAPRVRRCSCGADPRACSRTDASGADEAVSPYEPWQAKSPAPGLSELLVNVALLSTEAPKTWADGPRALAATECAETLHWNIEWLRLNAQHTRVSRPRSPHGGSPLRSEVGRPGREIVVQQRPLKEVVAIGVIAVETSQPADHARCEEHVGAACDDCGALGSLKIRFLAGAVPLHVVGEHIPSRRQGLDESTSSSRIRNCRSP